MRRLSLHERGDDPAEGPDAAKGLALESARDIAMGAAERLAHTSLTGIAADHRMTPEDLRRSMKGESVTVDEDGIRVTVEFE